VEGEEIELTITYHFDSLKNLGCFFQRSYNGQSREVTTPKTAILKVESNYKPIKNPRFEILSLINNKRKTGIIKMLNKNLIVQEIKPKNNHEYSILWDQWDIFRI